MIHRKSWASWFPFHKTAPTVLTLYNFPLDPNSEEDLRALISYESGDFTEALLWRHKKQLEKAGSL